MRTLARTNKFSQNTLMRQTLDKRTRNNKRYNNEDLYATINCEDRVNDIMQIYTPRDWIQLPSVERLK